MCSSRLAMAFRCRMVAASVGVGVRARVCMCVCVFGDREEGRRGGRGHVGDRMVGTRNVAVGARGGLGVRAEPLRQAACARPAGALQQTCAHDPHHTPRPCVAADSHLTGHHTAATARRPAPCAANGTRRRACSTRPLPHELVLAHVRSGRDPAELGSGLSTHQFGRFFYQPRHDGVEVSMAARTKRTAGAVRVTTPRVSGMRGATQTPHARDKKREQRAPATHCARAQGATHGCKTARARGARGVMCGVHWGCRP